MKYLMAVFCLLTFGLSSCSRVPITGRRQLNLVPESTVEQLALTQYSSFLSSNHTVSEGSSADARMVQTVGQRIAQAVTLYLDQHQMADRIAGYHWEFHLVQNSEVNAWCMPGGKVVVYTGIMPLIKSPTDLAVVLGHEIAHAIARHGNERMSQQLVAQGVQLAGAVALDKNPQVQNIFLQSFGVGGNLGMLAFSRQDELEADHLGLIFMAMAGYDPRDAIPFWQRMEQVSKSGQTPPVFLSDHPSDAQRLAQIQRLLPEALTYYHPHG